MTDRSQTVVYTIHHRMASSSFSTRDKFFKYVATLKNPKRKKGRKSNFKVNLLMMQTFLHPKTFCFFMN